MTQPNILVSISAPPKTGKTYLACTFPAPIKLYSFDQGADWLVGKYFKDKDITIHNFYLPIVESESEDWAYPIWSEFYQEFKVDVDRGSKFQTLILDTATAVETVLRQSILEELREDKPGKKKLATNEYIARNARMTAMFSRARQNGKNLVCIQYLREVWRKREGSDKAEPTGEITIDGWNQTEGQVDIILTMDERSVAGKSTMVTTIKGNRFDRQFNRQTFNDTNYSELASLSLVNSMDSLEQVNTEVLCCVRCELRAGATRPVPGFGLVGAKYFLIGEAPGREEDEAGIPFVGMSGRRLNKLIALAGLSLNDCYLTNVCRCRPPSNRVPRKKEIKSCEGYLWRELHLVKPEFVITLGSTPLSLFSTSGVSQMHGSSLEFEIPD